MCIEQKLAWRFIKKNSIKILSILFAIISAYIASRKIKHNSVVESC